MAGYAAMVRIDSAAPRFVADRSAAGVPLGPATADPAAIEELRGAPAADRLADLWDDVREVWRQALYVLSDPGACR
jgi:hypothetical protein